MHAVALSDSKLIKKEHLPATIFANEANRISMLSSGSHKLSEIKMKYVKETLEKTKGNQAAAAAILLTLSLIFHFYRNWIPTFVGMTRSYVKLS
ncbi:MAG: hypothetical protein JW841_07820, partial [Deltaproteobacteria bacterium]|nr:hypothetical protein [Deltaproteobacteria bacterium]